ncbi:hypothetical protein CDAR_507601 [Caerostris darwini]|uniref:Uncharacterized protein n=1 Tax=Caerostris darwini TaxID=1538125 RepID=A0AAV4MZ10_9ARAC|nr:hypothetical protein CDAR_507601 [Caerostris darwini]
MDDTALQHLDPKGMNPLQHLDPKGMNPLQQLDPKGMNPLICLDPVKRLLFQKNSHQPKRGGSSFLFRADDSQRIRRPSITQGGGVQTNIFPRRQ